MSARRLLSRDIARLEPRELRESKTMVVDVVEEPAFNIGERGTYIPVSDRLPPEERRVLIRQLKAQNAGDTILGACVMLAWGALALFGICALIGLFYVFSLIQ